MWEICSCQKDDEIYPKGFREIKSAPKLLYYKGDTTICNDMVIAVIGKRDASARYLEIARRIGRILAQKGITVLNGLALGIDTEKDGGTMQTVDYAVKFSKPLGCFAEKEGIQSPEGNQLLIETRKACPIGDKAALMEFLNRQDYYQMSLFG